ncbi:hypothetical protein E9993_15610 [Labilibacter sediminis]|nr:hypothetical protein E9993_15610 [Labilibacter sediminis]
MKTFLRKIVFNLILNISRVWNKISLHRTNKQLRAMILAPSWEGSIGDEAVIDSISYQLKEKGYSTTLIHFGEKKEWNYLTHIDEWHSIPKYFKSGGWNDHIKFITIFTKYTHFYCMGTDMMDGCYASWLTNGLINITNHAAYAGLKTTLVGFSINAWQRPEVIRNLGNMHSSVRYCLRDDVSLKRFKELIPNKQTILTADMAFLLEPTFKADHITSAAQWIKKQKEDNQLVIGINVNPQLFDHPSKTEELKQSFAKALPEIYSKYEQKISFILIPHDFREYNNDLKLLSELFQQLKNQLPDNLYLIDKAFMASDMKGMVEYLDLVVTARMHLSIACLGQGTPIGCLVYQGKFEGLFNHFQLKNNDLISPEDALDEEQLLLFIDQCIRKRLTTKVVISNELRNVKHKSAQNIC